MQSWEVDIKCPLCGAKVRLNRMGRHRNRRHPDISSEEFKAQLVRLVSSDPSAINTKRAVRSAADANGTKALMQAKKHTKRVAIVFSGGAIGLGKRKCP